jgi:ABC-type nitrate/sulfonate/bicarbonate transport system permease component
MGQSPNFRSRWRWSEQWWAIVGGDAGLGYLLMVANGSMDTQLLFAGIVALTVLGIALFLLVELAERLAILRGALP